MLTKPFAPSVLPLRDGGRVYHLNLLPGELADTIFFVGDPDRVSMVSYYFDQIELVRQNREFITHTGTVSGKRVSVISTGMGVGNVDIVLNEVDALHNINFSTRLVNPDPVVLDLIRIGTCGSLDKTLSPGEHVMSQYAVGFDGALSYYALSPTRTHQRFQSMVDSVFEECALRHSIYTGVGDSELCATLAKIGHSGITFTCPGFYAAQNRQLRVPITNIDLMSRGHDLLFNDHAVLNFEMETAMLLGLGAAMGHRCASMSLVVYNRITEQGMADSTKSMSQLIRQVLDVTRG